MSARATAISCTSWRCVRRSARPMMNSLTTSNESFPPSTAMTPSSLLRPTALCFRLGIRPHRATAIADLLVQALRRRPVFAHVPDFDPVHVADHEHIFLETRVVHQLLGHHQAALGVDGNELAARREVPHVPGGVLGLARLLAELVLDRLPARLGVEAKAMFAGDGAGHDEEALLVLGVVDERTELGGKNQPVLLVDRVREFSEEHRDNPLTGSTLPHCHPLCPTSADRKTAERVSRRN